jgi:Arc-like DNA binding domain
MKDCLNGVAMRGRSKKRRKKQPHDAPVGPQRAKDATVSAGKAAIGSTRKYPPVPPHRRRLTETVQLKLRFSEALRRQLEEAAVHNRSSLNAEIIKRLEASFIAPDRLPRLVADALLKGLDPDIVDAMGDTLIEQWQSDQVAMSYDEHDDPSREENK